MLLSKAIQNIGIFKSVEIRGRFFHRRHQCITKLSNSSKMEPSVSKSAESNFEIPLDNLGSSCSCNKCMKSFLKWVKNRMKKYQN